MNGTMLRHLLWTQSKPRQTDGMVREIVRWCEHFGAEWELHDGNLYVVKGERGNGFYPTYVAHTDTVHAFEQGYEVWRTGTEANPKTYFAKNAAGEQVGVGGDDKCGIYLALYMIEKLPAVKAAFFRDEEIGCLGSANAKMDFFTDSAFVLQGDRRGYGDFVNRIGGVDLYGDEFRQQITSLLDRYHMKESWGAMTDVQELKEKGLGVAAANVACAYYLPHSAKEYINVAELTRVQGLFRRMAERFAYRQWEHVAKIPTYHYEGGEYYGAWRTGSGKTKGYQNYTVGKGGNLISIPATTGDDGGIDDPTAYGWGRYDCSDMMEDEWVNALAIRAQEMNGRELLKSRAKHMKGYFLNDDPLSMRWENDDDPLVAEAIKAWAQMLDMFDGDCPCCGETSLMWDRIYRAYFCITCERHTKFIYNVGGTEMILTPDEKWEWVRKEVKAS